MSVNIYDKEKGKLIKIAGNSNGNVAIDDVNVSNKQFATGKSGSFDITVGSNEYGFIAFSSSFGTLSSVKIGGFDTDVISCGTISFTNASGGTTNYNIYRTGRHSLGAITMVIN